MIEMNIFDMGKRKVTTCQPYHKWKMNSNPFKHWTEFELATAATPTPAVAITKPIEKCIHVFVTLSMQMFVLIRMHLIITFNPVNIQILYISISFLDHNSPLLGRCIYASHNKCYCCSFFLIFYIFFPILFHFLKSEQRTQTNKKCRFIIIIVVLFIVSYFCTNRIPFSQAQLVIIIIIEWSLCGKIFLMFLKRVHCVPIRRFV